MRIFLLTASKCFVFSGFSQDTFVIVAASNFLNNPRLKYRRQKRKASFVRPRL